MFLLPAYISASQPDASRILIDSPWAVPTDATMDDPADKAEIEQVAPPAGVGQPGANNGRSNSSAGGAPRWDGGITKNRRGHLATIPVLVRWDSAAVIRHALERRHDPDAPALDAAAPANFVISVTGLLPAKQQQLGEPATLQSKSTSDDSQPSNSSPQTTEEMLEWFMNNSRLLTKGEAALQPQNVKVDARTGAVQLYFKRSDVFVVRKRDVLFVTRFGAMNVQTRFRTKDMQVDGRPDL